MMTAFVPRIHITKVEDLFGRDILMKQLLSLAKNNSSVAITGLRRFGKTSLLKCVESSLQKSVEHQIYPIYFDFKEVGSLIKGTDNVYRYMIACLTAKLHEDGHFLDDLTIRKTTLMPSSDWEDVFESLSTVSSVRIQGLFEEFVQFFSEHLGQTVLFLIDEYEWLFRFSFDEPVGFMKLRNFSSKASLGIPPFNFWVAGAVSWDHLCTITGSGELNVIDAPPIFVGSIDYKSFEAMWRNETAKIENCPTYIENAVDFAFTCSGGIPFYGKKIGNYLLLNQEKPSYSVIKSHFVEVVDSLQTEEKQILQELAKSPMSLRPSKYVLDLFHKDLIERDGNNYKIKIGLLRDYMMDNTTSSVNAKYDLPETQQVTDCITSLITSINKTQKNKGKSYVFEPVVDEAALIHDLRTPCLSSELFADFASSLYKIVFERTKLLKKHASIPKGRLPESFKRNNQFIEIVDILRHSLGGGHLMDTFISRPSKMTKAEMLHILVGSKNEPHTPEEFYHLQLSVLRLFKTELDKLNQIVRSGT